VLLRTAFAGLCHSDLHFMEGLFPIPTPVVLGHRLRGSDPRFSEMSEAVTRR